MRAVLEEVIGPMGVIGSRLKFTLTLLAAGVLGALGPSAEARVGLRLYLDVPFYPFIPFYYVPPYYPAPPYYPPSIVPYPPAAPASEVPPPPSPRTAYYYYCTASDGYYPYVRECPGGWQRIPAVPAP